MFRCRLSAIALWLMVVLTSNLRLKSQGLQIAVVGLRGEVAEDEDAPGVMLLIREQLRLARECEIMFAGTVQTNHLIRLHKNVPITLSNIELLTTLFPLKRELPFLRKIALA